MTGSAALRQFLSELSCLALIASTRFSLLPEEVTATEFVPFCAFVGGMTGGLRNALMGRPHTSPAGESFRGACYGALFGFLLIVFGVIEQ